MVMSMNQQFSHVNHILCMRVYICEYIYNIYVYIFETLCFYKFYCVFNKGHILRAIFCLLESNRYCGFLSPFLFLLLLQTSHSCFIYQQHKAKKKTSNWKDPLHLCITERNVFMWNSETKGVYCN